MKREPVGLILLLRFRIATDEILYHDRSHAPKIFDYCLIPHAAHEAQPIPRFVIAYVSKNRSQNAPQLEICKAKGLL